jgi:hypothetical protein
MMRTGGFAPVKKRTAERPRDTKRSDFVGHYSIQLYPHSGITWNILAIFGPTIIS